MLAASFCDVLRPACLSFLPSVTDDRRCGSASGDAAAEAPRPRRYRQSLLDRATEIRQGRREIRVGGLPAVTHLDDRAVEPERRRPLGEHAFLLEPVDLVSLVIRTGLTLAFHIRTVSFETGE